MSNLPSEMMKAFLGESSFKVGSRVVSRRSVSLEIDVIAA